ncbi:MAG: ketol-acid reductoisomerase, partial [Candidatus Eisenbacteria bacterium]|nr:ketol-acid reductoisomerase [Candidatus Eisenbacteria bacterium]
MPVFRDEECPRDPIRGWRIGICGYGNQGRAQALNLRDSGCDVVVIAAAKRPSAAQA